MFKLEGYQNENTLITHGKEFQSLSSVTENMFFYIPLLYTSSSVGTKWNISAKDYTLLNCKYTINPFRGF